MLQEFKDFINRGNVVDLAVAVVIGTAFTAVVTSFTDNILNPLIAAVAGEPNLNEVLVIDIGDSAVALGAFAGAILDFLIIAFAVFLIVKGINAAQNLRSPAEDTAVAAREEVDVLEEILTELRRGPGASGA